MDDLYSGKKAVVGIIGLGYVGMPLALAAWRAGFRVVGFDIDPQKAASINAGESYLRHIPSAEISAAFPPDDCAPRRVSKRCATWTPSSSAYRRR
jgi:UDP-N-acetyl-D-mannosaminuronate dehydrogenase